MEPYGCQFDIVEDKSFTIAIRGLGMNTMNKVYVELTSAIRDGTPDNGYPGLRLLLAELGDFLPPTD